MFSPLSRLWIVVLCLLALTSLTSTSYAQNANVTTWHNDMNRTGWQSNEAYLTQSNVQSTFGLLWQWPVTGFVFAQPLAVSSVQAQACQGCNLVFIATEQDMLYAFNAASSSSNAVWSLNLAQQVGGSPVTCNPGPANFVPCQSGLIGPYVGVTGTPVIDTTASPQTLYVVAAVEFPNSSVSYYLFAVDITKGQVLGTPAVISGSVTGQSPGASNKCTSDYPAQGQVTFDSNHIQRSALLLLKGNVYVAFAPGDHGEIENGWMFGYSFNGSTFAQTGTFNSTPYGTGGGIWQSGAGPASDGTYIYAVTANGTLFDTITQQIPYDIGDSLVKLDPANNLNVYDFYAPPDGGKPRCVADLDFGSGGVLVFPSRFTYNSLQVMVNADKTSNLFVTNQANLGKFTSGGNNIETVLTPVDSQGQKLDPGQGYWASPAYWQYTQNGVNFNMLYYSATTGTKQAAPYPINAYQMLTSGTSGPILQTPTASTPVGFCQYSPTPSVSSNGTMAGTGIVWAIEHGNSNNPTQGNGTAQQAALHAFSATNLGQKLYNSRGLQHHTTGSVTTFSTPTIFNGQVYMATQTEVNVFGLCSSQPSGCPAQ